MTKKIPIKGSEPPPQSGTVKIGPAPSHEIIRVNVYVRGPEPGDISHSADQFAFSGHARRKPLQQAEFVLNHAAPPDNLNKVGDFAREYGLNIDHVDASKCLIKLSGPISAMNQAFGVDLTIFDKSGVHFRSYAGAVNIPQELEDVITLVIGLDNHPIERRLQSVLSSADPLAPQPGSLGLYTVPELAHAYNFPAYQGDGHCLGLIQMGSGFFQSDLDSYFSSLGIPTPEIVVVGTNDPGTIANPNKGYGEVVMDIEVAAAVAPNAKTVVYFATENTQLGFIEVIHEAIHDTVNRPEVISISWGEPETAWTQAAADQMRRIITEAALFGVTICVASGDQGASDGVDDKLVADFPGSVPEVLCCGGTRLIAKHGKIDSETVWNNPFWNLSTGGGVSGLFAKPAYQVDARIQPEPQPPANALPTGFIGRCVPDVAANADPLTGYSLYILGAWHVSGGTSAVAPLWAGLITRLNQALSRPVGFINPFLYSLLGKPDYTAVHDITEGDNNYYHATPGWDACTGLGSPDGTALLRAMSATPSLDHDQP